VCTTTPSLYLILIFFFLLIVFTCTLLKMFAACFIFSYFCLCAETKFSIFFGAEPFDLAMGLWKLFTFFDPDLHCKLKFFSHLSLSLSLSPPPPTLSLLLLWCWGCNSRTLQARQILCHF
jgi:hypothetical protein